MELEPALGVDETVGRTFEEGAGVLSKLVSGSIRQRRRTQNGEGVHPQIGCCSPCPDERVCQQRLQLR